MGNLVSRTKSAILALGAAVAGSLLLLGTEQPPAAHGQGHGLSVDAGPRPVTALGRLEPKDGVIRVAGPSRPAVVIAKLLVEEGEMVREGQPLAVLDSYASHKAEVLHRLIRRTRREWLSSTSSLRIGSGRAGAPSDNASGQAPKDRGSKSSA